MNYSKGDVAKTLCETAELFNNKAKDTILLENKGKHLLEINLILKHIENKSKILDVGGGVGVNLICLRKLHEINIELYLIDQFEEYNENNRMGSSDDGLNILQDAKACVKKQNFIDNPIFPYPSNFFDVITCFDVIEHLPNNPLKLFGEIKNKLKHDGILIVGVPNAVSFHRRMKLLMGKHPYIPFDEWCLERYYNHYREYSIHELPKMLAMAGFNVVETISSEEPIATMARSRYHNRQHALFSGISFALYINYFFEKLLPEMRQSIYCIAQKRS